VAPTLTTPDGQVVDTPVAPADPAGRGVDLAAAEREFSRAMASEDPAGTQGPPRRPEDDGQGEAPKRRRGRPRKDPADSARIARGPAPDAGPVDYTEAAAGLVTLGWATIAAIPYTTPFAAVLDANAEQLTGALANGARHNPKIAAALERAASGGGGVYAVQLAAVGVNMGMQCLEIMRDKDTRAAATEATRTKFRAFLAAQGIKTPDDSRETSADHAPAAA
jgi:hypothetical protein